jgi:ATP-dependent helicase/DNAse subunit B
MIRIVRSQIGYLEDLRQIFENSYDSERLTGEPRPHRNSYPIPLLRKQPEQLEDVMKSITAVVAERERFYKELRILLKDLELARTLVISALLAMIGSFAARNKRLTGFVVSGRRSS